MMKWNQLVVSSVSTMLLAFSPTGSSQDECNGALDAFLQLTEPFDTDVFVGADELNPVPGDSYNWGGNRLCSGNDNADCDTPVGLGYGMSTFLPGNDTFATDEYYVLGELGTLTLTSIEYPGSTPLATVTGGTGCFAGAFGQTTATLVSEDEEYFNYDLSGVVLVGTAPSSTSSSSFADE